MALLFWEGFDTYNNLAELVAAKPYINAGYMAFLGLTVDWQNTGGRFGGKCVGDGYWTYWGLINISNFSTPTELYTGRAVKTGTDNALVCFWGNAGGTNLPDIYVEVIGGTVRVQRIDISGNYTVLGSSTDLMSYNAYHFIEVRCVMSTNNTTANGIVEVWMDNKKIISLTNVITKRDNASTYWMGVNLNVPSRYGTPYTDDIYITDTTGPAPWNGRLGDCRIASVPVVSDIGPNQGQVNSGNTNHYTAVSDIPYNSVDYIRFNALDAGLGEMFKIGSIPSDNTYSIMATGVVVAGYKTDAGTAKFNISIKPGANTYNSDTQYLATSNTHFIKQWTTNPNTNLQWTLSDFANANIGFYIV